MNIVLLVFYLERERGERIDRQELLLLLLLLTDHHHDSYPYSGVAIDFE